MSAAPVVAGARLIAAELTRRVLVPRLAAAIERIGTRSDRARSAFGERTGTTPEAWFFGGGDPARASAEARSRLGARDDVVVLGPEQLAPLRAEALRRFRAHGDRVRDGVDETLEREERTFLDELERLLLDAATDEVISRRASVVVNVSGSDPERVAELVERFTAQGYRVDVQLLEAEARETAPDGPARGPARGERAAASTAPAEASTTSGPAGAAAKRTTAKATGAASTASRGATAPAGRPTTAGAAGVDASAPETARSTSAKAASTKATRATASTPKTATRSTSTKAAPTKATRATPSTPKTATRSTSTKAAPTKATGATASTPETATRSTSTNAATAKRRATTAAAPTASRASRTSAGPRARATGTRARGGAGLG